MAPTSDTGGAVSKQDLRERDRLILRTILRNGLSGGLVFAAVLLAFYGWRGQLSLFILVQILIKSALFAIGGGWFSVRASRPASSGMCCDDENQGK